MGIFDVVKKLCEERNISISSVERDLDFGRGSLYKMETSSPSGDKISKIADYFGVSTDFILGKTEIPDAPDNIKKILDTKDGLYFKFAKKAEELDLSENDLQFIVETYLLHKKHSDK